MDEDTLNVSVRKFLKKLGVTAQREMEKAVRDAVAAAEGNQVPRWQAPPGNLYTSDNILMADLTMDLLPKYLGKYSHPTK